ncbi:hypothetical protein [Stenotrophomonas sp. S41]|uniref:hypothetical protein n=1 Tax=Stenotrophomonas sp. S41 TaxID=2767464 RepID=UPI00190AD4D1|nr:hypothetical protein [Stenotrophomonas sp. S41]MBK0013281.1 hypothetical protein [Stenotrophomonas sp. S41]
MKRTWIVASGFAVAVLLALAAISPPAQASGTHFSFYSDEQTDGFHFLLEIQGRSDDGYIHVVWTGKADGAPERNPYYVEMNRREKRLYVRPRKRDGQPWFELDVIGDRGTLLFQGRRIHGTADWEIR